MSNLVISTYDESYKEDFIRLNTQWITTFFRLEESDIQTLNNIEEYVIDNGGQIFIANYNNQVVGCCALIYHIDLESFELAKMAVDPQYQGLKIGKALGLYLLDYARRRGIKEIFLEGNTKMKASIELYKKIGFYEIPIKDAAYERCDIKMKIDLG